MRNLAVFLLFLASAVALRCSHAPVGPYSDPGKFWEKVQRGYDRPAGPYAASGTISVASPGFNHSAGFTLRWESASRLRIDLTGPFGISLASVALQDSLAWVSVPLRGTYLRGSLAQIDSAAAGALNLSLDRLIRAIGGLPPRQEGRYQQTLPGKGTIEFVFAGNDTSRTFTVDQRNGEISRYAVRIGGKPWAELEYGDFRPAGDYPRPYRVRMASPASEMNLELVFDSIRPAPSFPGGIWEQSVPEGTLPQRFK
jgi:hypothetical protein